MHRAAVGRADLLRLLDVLQADALVAKLTGFAPPAPAVQESLSAAIAIIGGTLQAGAPSMAPAGTAQPPLQARHIAIVAHESVALEGNTAADALDAAGPLHTDPICADLSLPAPAPLPLASPRRLASFIRSTFRRPAATHLPDVARWVKAIAFGRLPQRLPMRQLPSWASGGALCIHASADMQPLNPDLQALMQAVQRWSGGRVAQRWCDASGQWWQRLAGPSHAALRWQGLSPAQAARYSHALWVGSAQGLPAALGLPGVPVPGHSTEAGASQSGPARLAQPAALQRGTGHALTLLSPNGLAPAAWPAHARWVAWDRGQRLRLQRPHFGPAGAALAPATPVPATPDGSEPLADLLACLAMAVRVEPALLRAIRLQLGLAAAAELAVWQHADVDSCALGLQVRADRLPAHRQHLCQALPLKLRRAIAQTVRAQHVNLSPLIRDEEAALAALLASGSASDPASDLASDLASDGPADVAEACASTGPTVRDVGAPTPPWLVRARTLAQQPASAGAQDAARYVRRLASRAHPGQWAATPGLAETWLLAEQDSVRAGAPLPPGIAPAAVARVLGRGQTGGAAHTYHLVQRGRQVRLQAGPASAQQSPLGQIGPVASGGGMLLSDALGTRWVPLPQGHASSVLFALDGLGPWQLRAGAEALTLAPISRPPWAAAWGRDRAGLYALPPPLGDWQPRLDVPLNAAINPQSPWLPAGTHTVALEPIFPFHPTHNRAPRLSATAGLSLGVDEGYGVFASLGINGVTQHLRWMPPGEFWMGSTDSERARIGDEQYEKYASNESPRHRVRLSQGFWLADTACTQALWLAVMGGKNPSGFSDDAQCPVEEVSFDDIERFLQRLQSLLPPGCKAVLPSEAEWEYACRAGTQTAFNLGDNVTPEQVNYDGNYAFAEGAKGLYRSRTVPVKSLPANAWGLYEMHGNVWEWCRDDLRNYAQTARDDGLVDPEEPVGQEQAAHRAVRGGSWLFHARDARSAFRYAFARVDRLRSLGFRLALRSTSPEDPEGPAGGSVGVRPAQDARGPARRDAGPARGGLINAAKRMLGLGDVSSTKPKPKPKGKP